MERLQKVIAESGYTSRRKAEELITQGRVSVDGIVIKELGTKVTGEEDIMVDGETLKREEHVYYLLNKPIGVVSTVKDEKGRKSVVDLIKTTKRIYPIGRLDYNTTGLLLLTNDGELDNLLSHPTSHIEKTYVAHINHAILTEDIYKLKDGIMIDDMICKPTRVKVRSIDKKKDTSTIEITIVEGRNHIVKRLFESLGYKVTKLNRTQYDFLTIDDVPVGTYRTLTLKEVHKLYASQTTNK
ncbi:MAG TPA: pseudouridine synthase [Bacilli bacterium]|jgi:23S rRNA pseudouridine2605 synthase|nr:pseudouridine synthase [Bacilli bacterium]HPZ23318.1 pseudouridine synthase [Bacilli bacterium]HQC84084.1 pseudouridine synthase [Bacilli bacterium]